MIIRLFFLLLSSFIIVRSEIVDGIGVSFGIGQSNEQVFEYSTCSIRSYSASISLSVISSKYFLLKPELAYDIKGSETRITKSYFNENEQVIVIPGYLLSTNRSQYVSFRLLAKPKIPIRHNLTPYFLCGPRIDLLVNKTIYVENNTTLDKTGDLSRWVFGISSGIGMEYKIKHLSISPFALVNTDINTTTGHNEEYRNLQYYIALELSYALKH